MSERPNRPSSGLVWPSGLVRRPDDRMIGGVCAAIARYLGIDPVVVRLAVVVLALANAVGVALYLAAWVLIPTASAQARRALGMAPGQAEGPGPDGTAGTVQPVLDRQHSLRNALAVGCITFGLLVSIKSVTPVFPDHVVWPATVVALGLGVGWARASDGERARWRRMAARLPGDPAAVLSGRGLWLRLVLGGALLITGLAWFLATNQTLSSVGAVGLAVLATVLGICVLCGPWVLGLFQQLGYERHERIRNQERADMAAHLHDSVLQTLALIQRQSETPQQARRLARRQERELRAWLFDSRTPEAGAPRTLAAAIDLVSDDVEADHDVTVDAVVVGDRPLDPHVEALVGALREAVVNAAKYSGESEVSVYVEVEESAIEAFVRDRGKGFDMKVVQVDRRGIADSIIGRMARHGGTAHIRSAPGEGTEVTLRLVFQPGEAT